MEVARCLDLGDKVVCVTPSFEIFRANIVSREDAGLCDSLMLLAAFIANRLSYYETWLEANERGVARLEDRVDMETEAMKHRRWISTLKEMYEELCTNRGSG